MSSVTISSFSYLLHADLIRFMYARSWGVISRPRIALVLDSRGSTGLVDQDGCRNAVSPSA